MGAGDEKQQRSRRLSWQQFPAAWKLELPGGENQQKGWHYPSQLQFTAALPAGKVSWIWDERDQRKGRAATLVSSPVPVEIPRFQYIGVDVGDISWWVGFMYALGAVCWITNGAAAAWPLADATVQLWLLGVTSLMGGSLFHLGAMCQYWEALNAGRTARFGYHLDESRGLLVASLRRRRRHCFQPRVWGAADGEGASERMGSVVLRVGSGADEAPLLGGGGGRGARSARGAAASSTAASVITSDGANAAPPAQPATARFPSRSASTAAVAGGGDGGGAVCASGAAESDGALAAPPSAAATAPAALRGGGGSAAGAAAPTQRQEQLAGGCGVGKDVHAASFSVSAGDAASQSGASGAWSWDAVSATPEGWVWCGFPWRQLNFVAAFTQGIGTTIFLFACICGFPYVLPVDFEAGDWVLWDALYWGPFLLGSCLFIASAAMFMVAVQPRWHTPAPGRLAWWLNLLNLFGSVGFWLCSFFGFFAYPAQRFQKWGTAFSCLWGSCCFLASAYLQMLEALNKFPRPERATLLRVDPPLRRASQEGRAA